jgi:large conductance mechanosensitive channel
MAESKGIVSGFKEFILRGNVVDLAIAVVIGTAFSAVIKALVADILTPLIAAIVGKPSFETLTFTIHKSKFLYGDLINNLITFVSVAAAIYFFVVVPLNHVAERRARGVVEADTTDRACPECISVIPKAATRCAFCTAVVAAAS